MMSREFLMMPQKYKPGTKVSGWYVAQNLDGVRAFWDGGVSRGISIYEVPWAGVIDPETERPRRDIFKEATGLWSTSGLPILAPDWFLNLLPPLMLDGCLWAGWGNQKLCEDICECGTQGSLWYKMEYAVFSTPHPSNFAFDGFIKNTQMFCLMSASKIMNFIEKRNKELGGGMMRVQDGSTFEEELACLRNCFDDDRVYLQCHKKLPEESAEKALKTELKKGKNLILRDPLSQWIPQITKSMLRAIA